MILRMWRHSIVVVLGLIGLVGCHQPASSLSKANLDDAAKVKEAAPSYWEHDPNSVAARDFKNVALLEFAVEYVTEKLESLSDNQPGVVIHEFIPIGFATSMAGAGRIRVQIEEGLRKEFPDEMYRYFSERAAAEGIRFVSPESIKATKAYKSLNFGKPGHVDLGHAFNVAGTDVGVPRLLVIEPAKGFDLILGTKDGRSIEQVEKEMLKELGADAAVRVRFRVSVYRQVASMEKWSIVRVTKDSSVGFHFAERSLLSDEKVVKKEDFLPVAGIIKQIDSDAYRAAIKKLYPPFISMAVHTLAEHAMATPQGTN
ncbi:MAG: hypothetical protein HZA51_05995 [Planctomycetes bacterium]|nr:hypothetical protein [Planctomycetota bacterium]